MRWFIVCLLSVILALWIATPAISVVWSAGAFDSTPALGDPVSEGDDRIRELKEEIRYRAEVEHWWANDPDGEDNDNGLHRLGSGRCYVGTTAPTELSDSHSGIGAGNLADYDNTTDTTMSGENTLAGAATNSAAGIEDDVGHGRCWLDTDGPDDDILTLPDNNKMWVYVGGTGWVDTVWASVRPEGDDEILAGNHNLVYNGSMEATDGTGDPAATVVPAGFTAVGAATFTYGVGAGEDIRWGDGTYVIATDVGALDGMQTVLTNLSANTTYKVIARVAEANATDICTLATTGGLTNIAGEASAGVAWQTLSGTFTTAAAALDTVTLTFISTAIGDICYWDNIVVYQIGDVTTDRDEISQPGVVAMYNTYTAEGAVPNGGYGAVGTLGSVTFTPPTPGWVVQVGYTVSVGQNATYFFQCYLRQNAARITGTETNFLLIPNAVTAVENGFMASTYIGISPVPGTLLEFDVFCQASAAGSVFNFGPSESNLWLVATPTR